MGYNVDFYISVTPWNTGYNVDFHISTSPCNTGNFMFHLWDNIKLYFRVLKLYRQYTQILCTNENTVWDGFISRRHENKWNHLWQGTTPVLWFYNFTLNISQISHFTSLPIFVTKFTTMPVLITKSSVI